MKNIVTNPNYFRYSKTILFLMLAICLNTTNLLAQTAVDFTARYSDKLRGDLTLISNNILNRDAGVGQRPNDPYNDFKNKWGYYTYNDNFNMAYIDVDTDTSTFSSSKATLNIPNSTCLNVKFAGLYWGAIYKEASRASGYNTVKFKLPGAANYLDIEADDIIFDEEGRYTPDPYACFADVTGYLQALSSPVGEYTVANIHASLGKSGAGAPSGGTSGGWTLVVVYEDPLLTNKNITIFDGFSGVNMQGNSADISVAGFTTIPVGPVKASIGVSCIEGDANLGGDAYSIKSGSNVSFKVLSDPVNPSTNFFNSSITINGSHFTDKVPNSINNLGWDSDLFLVNNPSNSVIGNDENSATLRLQTNRDSYFVFQTSFAIEIIEPKIVVIKTVDDGTSDITGDSVILGESLWYQLRFQNTGNDSATNTIIKDLLPINVDLDEASIKLPSFVTYGYTLPTATTGGIITFDIDDSIVTKGATFYDIRFKVTVTDQCNDLRDACENKIENVAFAYYTGLVSGTEISDDPSFYGLDNCNFGLSGSTNFLVDVDGCTFERREVMCGASLDITAGDGFASYVWRNALGVEVGTSKTLTVTKLGVYTVEKTANLPCVDASETITVVPFGTQTNPLIVKDISGKYLYVDAVKTCPNDGRQLSEIYLCGTADYRDITVSNLGAQEIKWQRLISNQGAADQDCPNVDVKSNWEDLLGFTDSYKADTEGEYRLKIIYTGGCFTNYYFNVFKATVKPVIVEKNIICGNDGSITINNMDTSLYEFSVVLDGKPAGTFSSLVSYPITVAGNYTVYFRQIGANPLACIPTIQGINIATRTIDLENDITITVNDIFCAGNTGGIRVQVNNVPGDYTMVLHNLAGDEIGSYGPEPLNDYLFDALAGGNYRVTITTPDCLFITEIIQVKEEISLQLIAGISQNITCREGNIQVDPSGGKPPYNYAVHSYKLENDTGWTTIAPIDYVYQTSRIFDIPTINGAGEYKYIVEDRIFCTAISNIVKIVLEPDVDFDLETVDISCYGKESGSISFVLNDNSKKLAFALDDGIAGNGKYDAIISGSNPEAFEPDSFNNSGVFSNLPAGNYTFILRVGKSNKACFFTFPITITQPTDTLLGTLVESQDLTCNKLGEVTVSASGGTPPYQYSIDGITFVSSNVFKGLSSGSNIVTIRDANDCEVPTNTVVFIALDMPTDLSISQTQITCPSLTSDLTVDSVLGGTLPITYEIIAPAGAVINNGNNKIFTQLVADTYRIKVTDAKGCSYEEDYTIAAITEIAITGVVDNQLICKGGTSGNATYTVSGFTETYSYTLNDGTEIKGQNNNSILLTGVSAGTYTINITDEKTLCTDTVTVTLLEPAEDLSMSLTATPITCTSNATITATANGGWGALEYQLENAAGIALIPYGSSNLFTKVLPGDYTVFVKDINGCIEPDTITIDPVVIPTVSLIANTVCYTAAGTITITATGTGSGPLQYALNGGAYQVGTVFTNILPGDHSVTVKDMYGCTATSTVMSISTELSLSTQFVSISACGTGTDVTITANGGDGTYTYSVVATGGVPTYGASNVISINTAGVYDVTIKDGKDCIASETITIVKDSALTILAPSTKILCNGELSSITADASGGQAPYQYQLEDTSGGILTSYQASPVFNNVSAGDYKIRLKDARACTETVNITITEPVILAAIVNTLDLVSCNNNIDAAVEITWLSGGVAPYVYSFDTVNYSDSNTGRLTAGNHTVFLRDANLCIFSMSVTIAAPLKAPTFTTSTVVYNCDGTANVSISPVDPLPLFDYTYNLNATGAVGPNNGLGFDFTDLGVGTHSIEIGYTPISPLVACPRTEIITVVVAPNMEFNAVITASTDISCKAGNNGDITVQVSNFDTTQGYQYSLDGGANWKATLFINTFTVPLLKVGSYTIAVRDVRSEGVNCTINLSQTLNEPTLLVASAKITEVLTCNNVGGEITASAVGGIVAYEYQLENTTGTVHTPYGPDNLFTNVLVGDYIVFVRDANECESQVTITMNPAITPTLIIEADTDCYTATGNVTITATGTGTAPLKYALNGGAYQESNEFSNVLPGIHEVTVKDVYGCEVTATTLTVFNELTLSTQFLSISACTNTTDVTITANGGDGTYMYSIMPTGVNPTAGDYGTDNVITINVIGNYDVYVKDGEKCETFETITIVKDPLLTIGATSIAVLCNGGVSVITASPGGGQTPYEYRLKDNLTGIFTPYQVSPIFNNITAGDYNVEVRDARACTETVNETITEPAILAAIVNTLDLVSCNNNIDAAVAIVSVTGGTPPYVYSFDSVNYSGSNTERLKAGNHTVFIRDANLCIVSLPVTIAAPLKAPTFTTSVLAYTCDGRADVSISPVDPLPLFDYTYKLNTTGAVGPNNGLGFDFTDLGVGIHTIEIGYTPISPLVACPRIEIITIVVAPNMEFNAVITASTDISCNGGSDGDITVQVSNFDTIQGYQYSLDGGANWKATLFINTFTVPLLKVGSYTIAVRDVRSDGVNCIINLSQTLNEPTLVVASAKITQVLTCTNAGGAITASAVGGIGAYEYQLENTTGTVHTPYGPDNLFTNVLVGDYIVFVRDANECESQVAITMNPAITPTLSIEADTDCYTATGNVTISATGTGTAPLKYALNGGAYQESNEFSNVLPGIHEVTVKDVYGCEVTATTLTVFNELTLSTQFLSISACTDATDATITANGGDGTYMYSIMPTGVNPTAGDYGTDNVITINAIGNYDVYVKDGEKCETFETITIVKDLPLTISASSTPILCNGDLTTITGAGSGGEGPYSYRLENALDDEIRPYQSSPSFKNVSVGNYKVRVKDARNCDSSFVVNISEPAYLIASAGVTELVSCNNGLNAEVRITNAEGGTPFAEPNPYRYSFDGGMTYITSNISKLPSGTHTVYVKDAEGCTFPMEVVVAAKITAPDYIPSLTYDCDGNGIYTITAVDPMPLYSYTFNLDGVVDVPADITVPTYGGPTGISFPDIVPGTHTVNMNFTPIESPTKSVLLEESFGSGANTPITNIDPVYCYEPQDGTGGCIGGKHINDGEYSVTQKVAYPFGSWRNPNDHSDMINGRFLVMNIGDVAGSNGIIYEKEVNDIVPNRDITISLFAFNLLKSGRGGVDPSIVIELVNEVGVVLAASPVAPAIPKNTNADDWHEFKVTLNPGAETKLSIVIRSGSTAISGNDIAIDDIFAYQEPEQCPSTISVTFTVATDKEFKVATNSVTDATCNGGSDGSIQMQVSNFDPLFGYQFSTDGGTTWSVTQFTNVLTVNGLDAGAHDIEIGYITDALGTQDCIETITEIIGEPTAVVASASITGNLTCTNAGATITASAVGGGGSYEYQLEDIAGLPIVAFKTSPVFINLAAGSYIVRVKDVFECEDIIDAQIDVVLPTPIIYTTSQTNCYAGDSNGSISVNVTAGNGNYQFSINGSAFQTPSPASGISHTFSNLTAGTYTIDVRDQFNCTVTSAVTIDSQLTGSALLVNDIDCNAPTNGEILINANGGAGGNTYQWSNDGGGIWNGTNFSGNIFTIGIDGNYIFKITDASGCFVITNTIRLTPAINPVFTLLATDVKCNGDLSGVIDITIDTTKGLAPYVINIINTISTTDYGTQTSGLPAGNYEVTVTDAKGCFTANLVTIAEPTAINGNITKIDISCANPFDVKGTISIDAGGSGTGPFTYRVYNNDYSFNETVDTDTLGGTNYTFSNLNFGGYKVVIIDTNGCESISDITIGTSPDILVTIVGVATCTAGSITVQANTTSGSLSTGPYYFAIYPIVTSAPGGAGWFAGTPGVLASGAATEEYTFNGLTPGVTYTFVVYDASTKCTYIQESDKLLNPISTLTSTIETITDITCTGASDGIVDFTISNYEASATQVDYQVYQTITINPILGQSGSFVGLTGVAASDSLTGLAPGEYYIQFTEVNGGNPGCITTSPPFLIQQSPVLLDIKASLTKNENCNKLGVITALAQYGTSPYEYQIQVDTDSAPTVGTWGGGNATGIFNVAVGDYKVFVKDAFNCIQSVDVSMLLDSSPEISVDNNDADCPTEGSFQVVIREDVAGVSPYSISVNGAAFQLVTLPYTVLNVSSGIDQTIEIRDVNGCGEVEIFTIVPPLEFNATITKLLDCSGAPNAEIVITDVIGSGNYTYQIDNVTTSTNYVPAGTVLPGIPFTWTKADVIGEYKIIITDTATNCPAVKSVTIVDAVVPIIPIAPIAVNALCSGSDDGSISITAQDNGIGPFTFEITAPLPIASITNNGFTAVFENLPGSVAGSNYTITIRGDNGCRTDQIVTVYEPMPVSIELINTTAFGCTTGNTPNAASISVTTVSGGNGTYTRYEFENSDGLVVQNGANSTLYIVYNTGTDTYSIDMGTTTPGKFTINVYDSNGCLATDTATIILFDEINNTSINVLEDISCENTGENIQIDVISIGGDPNKFVFSDDNGVTWQASNVFNDLVVGTHDFIIRHVDTGCTYPISHTIGEPNTFTPKVTIVNQVYCKGSTTGNVTFELEDTTYPGGFKWEIFDTKGTLTDDTDDTSVDTGTVVTTNGPTPNVVIAAGSYYVIITQNNIPSCNNRVYFTITEPIVRLSGTYTSTPITCKGKDGAIEITPNDGWGNYEYYVGTGAPNVGDWLASASFSGLGEGTYHVWIKDMSGCEFQIPDAKFNNPLPITGTLQIKTPNCTGNDGVLEVTGVIGGQGTNYQYQLFLNNIAIGSPQTNPIFSGLGRGTYRVDITDLWTCTGTTSAAIQLFDVLIPTVSTLKEIDCTGTPGGELTVAAAGGSGNYSYSMTQPDATVVTSVTGVYAGLTQVGVYRFTITDTDTNCVSQVIAEELFAPSVILIDSLVPTDTLCIGDANGTITVNMATSIAGTNDEPPYTYEITAPIIVTAQSSNVFTGLLTGTYTVRVTSVKGCPVTKDITIDDATAISLDTVDLVQFGCTAGNTPNTASITVSTVTGGTGNYMRYEFVNSDKTIVQNGASDVLIIAFDSSIDGYSVAMGGTIPGATFGEFTVNVYDSNGCIGTTTEIITIFNEINSATIAIEDAISCVNGGEDIRIEIDSVVSDRAQFEFSDDNGSTWQATNLPVDFYDLAVGTHQFLIRHKVTKCEYSISHTVVESNTFTAVANVVSDVDCIGTATSEVTFELIDATYAGGFNWTVFDLTDVPVVGLTGVGVANVVTSIQNIAAGSYYVAITQTGFPECTNKAYFTILEPAITLSGNYTTTNITCLGKDGTLDVLPVGGWGNYEYYVGTAVPTAGDWKSTSLFTGLTPGTYQVLLRDAGGCEIPLVDVTFNNPAAITGNLIIKAPNCTGNDGVLEVTGVTGGQGTNYQYQLILNGTPIGTPQSSPIFSGLGIGSYKVEVSDQWSCTATIAGGATVLFDTLIPVVTLVKEKDCTATPKGEITVSVTGGSGNYSYEIQEPDGTVSTGTSGVYTNLTQEGIYSFTITDVTTNCVSQVITEELFAASNVVIDSLVPTETLCIGAANGTITVILADTIFGTNDKPPYTYQITVGPVLAASQSSNVFTGLLAGKYTVEVTGTNACSVTKDITIDDATAISLDTVDLVQFGCTAGNTPNTASITVSTVTGGTGNYMRYEFVNSDGTIVQKGASNELIIAFDSAAADTYSVKMGGTTFGEFTVNVYDSNGCIGTTIKTILAFDEINSATITVVEPISCVNGGDAIRIEVVSDVSDRAQFEFSDDNGVNWQAANFPIDFIDLKVGTHQFLIRHKVTKCEYPISHTVVESNTFTAVVNVVSDVDCIGTATSEVTFELIDATYAGGFNWSVFDLSDVPVGLTGVGVANVVTSIQNIAAGSYYVAITQTGLPECTNKAYFTIAEPAKDLTGTYTSTNITCDGDDGILEIIPVGGWGNYEYYVGTAVPTAVDWKSTSLFTGLTPGTYQVWLRDAGGCEIPLADATFNNPDPITGNLIIKTSNCTGNNGVLEVTGVIGGQGTNYQYQLILNGTPIGDSQSSPIFSGLGVGSYEVEITDQWSCAATIPGVATVLFDTLIPVVSIVKAIDCTVTSDGEITVSVTGGSGTYSYEMTLPDAVTKVKNTTGIYTGLSQVGAYRFTIRDTLTKCKVSITEWLKAPSDVIIGSLIPTAVLCEGEANGTITVNLAPSIPGISNDEPPYTYEITGTKSVSAQSSNVFTGLPAGKYTVLVTSVKGCKETKDIIITEQKAVTISTVVSTFVCTSNNLTDIVTVTATGSNGTPGYLFSIDGVNFTNVKTFAIVDMGIDQEITITVKDINGCTATETITIKPLPTITGIAVTPNKAISCTNPENVTVTVTGGSGDFTYELLPIGTGSQTFVSQSADFDLPSVGSYTFKVIDNSTGCFILSTPYIVAPYDTISVTATATTPITCFGERNGSLTFEVFNYGDNYTWDVRDELGASVATGTGNVTTVNPVTITSLPGGNYTVYIVATDPAFCDATSNVITIGSPSTALNVVLNVTHKLTCDPGTDGEITAIGEFGWGTYEYQLSQGSVISEPYSTNNVFKDLVAGTYIVTVKDALGCAYSADIDISTPSPITAFARANTLICSGDVDGEITVTANGGQGAGTYVYSLINAFGTATVLQTSPVFNNLVAGTYTVLVTDNLNCDVITLPVTIVAPSPVIVAARLTNRISCTKDAIIEITASGGDGGPYTYSIDGINFNGVNKFNLSPATITTYQFFVRDGSGCVSYVSNGITVRPINPLKVIIDGINANITCNGGNNAVISAITSGGMGNYRYELLDGNDVVLDGPQNSSIFTDLSAGIYKVRVSSLDCEETSTPFAITEPKELRLASPASFTNITCFGEEDGTITVHAAGGTGKLIYSIDQIKYVSNNVFTNMESGSYTVIVQDENGCYINEDIVIVEPALLKMTFGLVNKEKCIDDKDGRIEVIITGGTPPYFTKLNTDGIFVQGKLNYDNLLGGFTYVIYVEDSVGCTQNLVIKFDAPVDLNFGTTIDYGCDGNMKIIASVDAKFENDVTYTLVSTTDSFTNTTGVFENLSPGAYLAEAEHVNGCVPAQSFVDLIDIRPTIVTLEESFVNTITAHVEFGMAPYEYSLDEDDFTSSNEFIVNKTGMYTVDVRDARGCISTATIYIEFIKVFIPNFFTPDGDGNNDYWYPQKLMGYPNIKVTVFDRYSRLIIEFRGPQVGWDGRLNGKALPSGDYWYVIDLDGLQGDKRKMMGNFTLYR